MEGCQEQGKGTATPTGTGLQGPHVGSQHHGLHGQCEYVKQHTCCLNSGRFKIIKAMVTRPFGTYNLSPLERRFGCCHGLERWKMHSAVLGLACQASVLKTPAHLLQTVMLPAPRGSKHSHGLIIVLKVGPHINLILMCGFIMCHYPGSLAPHGPQSVSASSPSERCAQPSCDPSDRVALLAPREQSCGV